MAEIKPPFESGASDEENESRIPMRVATSKSFDPSKYDFDDRFVFDESVAEQPRTTFQLLNYLETNPKNVEVDANVLCLEKESGRLIHKRMNRQELIENWKQFRENDAFGSDGLGCEGPGNLLGQDYVPLLSGPFFKQLYYYDYLKMHALAFQAYHHDPVAKRVINCILEFTLGRGYAVTFEDKADQAAWEGFDEANGLSDFRFKNIVREFLIYGEQFIWWLPNFEVNISWQVAHGQEPAKGLIPRIRQIDPSVIWEIVTFPEDIERVLYYQWVAPTQWQIYTGSYAGKPVPGMKWIFQQIMADELMHFKLNCVSNEKRGRSILFPVFGDLKRLRDTIDYAIAGSQKACAWSIDTEIEGSQADIDNYVSAQMAIGSTPPAGSEFVHTSKVKREYLGNKAAESQGNASLFDWVLSKIAMGVGMPVSYMGGHQSGGSNRASAVVATEPVTKMFEFYQQAYERILRQFAKRLKLKSRMDITFPELVTQDRSAKMRDIMAAERAGYVAKSRAATMCAKELNITDYDYDAEQTEISAEPAIDPSLLSPTGGGGGGGAGTKQSSELPAHEEPSAAKPSTLDSKTKRAISMRYGA